MKMEGKKGKADAIYINEIIRINYKCNWKCKFCNVLKTNNYGEHDVFDKEVILQVLKLTQKYSQDELRHLILSFSGGEPTLNPNISTFIRLAKKIGVGTVEIQTNGTTLFKDKEYINTLIDAGLDEIFLAQHSSKKSTNLEIGAYYSIDDFKEWVKYVHSKELHKKICIYLNIVVTKININTIPEFLIFLLDTGFIEFIPPKHHTDGGITRKISFGFCQPNGYAKINKDVVLLDFNDEQVSKVSEIVEVCKSHNLLPDFHFTGPPLCILPFPDYNLEYNRLKKLEEHTKNNAVNVGNLESYKWLWKEKEKLPECKKCKYNPHCLGFYKNWIDFVGREPLRRRVKSFIES